MPEHVAERGIGETRFASIERGEIIEARVLVEGVAPAGSVIEAQLVAAGANGRAALAIHRGTEYLLPKGAPGLTEGATALIEVTREAIPGAEPWKRPLARLIEEGEPQPARQIDAQLLGFPAPQDQLAAAGWWDLIDEARSGIVAFPGGELRVSVTPAMTLIDVDGRMSPDELAEAGVRAAARAILRHGIGGSIGIDLPTLESRARRQLLGELIDGHLPKPFERTAVNGFGFVQIVRPRRHASLFEIAAERAPFEARVLLRRAAFDESGPKRLAAHPAVIAVLESKPHWLAELGRQVGGAVSLRSDAKLPMSGGHAEPV